MNDLTQLAMRDASEAVRTGQISPVALTRAYLARIEAVDARIGSYILVLAEAALAAARAAQDEIMAGHWRGPLHGLPFAVKDNYFTRGVRTCASSRVRLNSVPEFDATALAKLTDAGAILLGKLNTWEFGTSMGAVYEDLPYPHARNPCEFIPIRSLAARAPDAPENYAMHSRFPSPGHGCPASTAESDL